MERDKIKIISIESKQPLTIPAHAFLASHYISKIQFEIEMGFLNSDEPVQVYNDGECKVCFTRIAKNSD